MLLEGMRETMQILKYEDWKALSGQKKIIYYPEFFYGALDYTRKVADPYYIENEIRKHLSRIKLLLLYFDYINMPFGHFYAPFDKIQTNLYYSFFENIDFRRLIANRYIIYTIRPTDSPLVYWEWIGEELYKCGFTNALSSNNALKYIFDDCYGS